MKMQKWRMSTMAGVGVLAAWFVACAGEDIPPIDDQLRADIDEEWGDGAGGQQASAGTGGSGATPRGGSGGAGGSGGSAQAGGGAAGASVVGGGGLSADVCDAYTTVILARCGGSGSCHASGSSQGAFALDGDPEAILQFVDRDSTVSTCNAKFIDPANTENSLLYTKTLQDFPAGCGSLQMPATGAFLTQEQTDCLQEWLTQFAE